MSESIQTHPVVLKSIAARMPEPRFGTEDLLASAGDRFSPGLRLMLRNLGVRHRHSILANFDEVLLAGAVPTWSVHALDLAVEATRASLSGIDSRDVGLVIAVTSTPPRLLPGLVSDLFAGVPEIPRHAMNVSMQGQGCAPLLKAVEVARWFLRANPGRLALVVCLESTTAMSPSLRDNSYGTFREGAGAERRRQTMDVLHGFLFGDAAVAFVVGSDGDGPVFGPTAHLTNTESADAELGFFVGSGSNPPLYLPDRGPALVLGKGIGRRGAEYARTTVKSLFEHPDMERTDMAAFPTALVHTGSNSILNAVADVLGLDGGKLDIAYSVLADYGNLGGASLGVMIAQALDRGARGPILLVTFGLGFSASAGILCGS